MSLARNVRILAAILFALGGVAMNFGCERGRGVVREASLPAVPDPQCVENAIRSVEAVLSVSHRSHPSEAPNWHSYLYKSEASVIQLTLTIEERKTTFRQSSIEYGKGKPSAEEIEATIALMKAVEERLEAECGAVFEGGVEQLCVGVRC